MGIPAEHLIAASVMSAPAALAVSKIIFPEDDKSKKDEKIEEVVNFDQSGDDMPDNVKNIFFLDFSFAKKCFH
jgi:nucleoside permease NupC